jgi:hypothetical protein
MKDVMTVAASGIRCERLFTSKLASIDNFQLTCDVATLKD